MTFAYARLVLLTRSGLLLAIWPVCDFAAWIALPLGTDFRVNFGCAFSAAAAGGGAAASPTVSNAAAVSPSTRARLRGRIGFGPSLRMWRSCGSIQWACRQRIGRR